MRAVHFRCAERSSTAARQAEAAHKKHAHDEGISPRGRTCGRAIHSRGARQARRRFNSAARHGGRGEKPAAQGRELEDGPIRHGRGRRNKEPDRRAARHVQSGVGAGAHTALRLLRERQGSSHWLGDVFEDELIGRETLDISAVLHDREVADEWIDLIDERGRRAIGASVRIVVQNGKAPPLMQLCAAEDVTLDQLEKSITQEPSQCDEREVEEATGRTCLHLLLANDLMDDAMLSLLLKCNHKQSRVADRHGTLPLSMLCKKYGA